MNNDRRKRLARAAQLISVAREIIAECATEERDAYDNESLQGSERGERSSEAADALEEAESAMEDAESNIETAANA